jgi:hypothetical protein
MAIRGEEEGGGRNGKSPIAMRQSCHGNHERKEGVEWKIKLRVPDCHGVAAHQSNTRVIKQFKY